MSSNNIARPKFNDPALQKTLESSAQVLEGFQSNLTALSEDIKNLEAYLDQTNVRLVASVQIWSSGTLGDGGSSIHEDEEYLEWAESEGGRWRVLYHLVRRFGDIDGDGYTLGPAWEDSKTVERKPLIETPVEVRLRAAKKLTPLLEALANKAVVERIDVPF